MEKPTESAKVASVQVDLIGGSPLLSVDGLPTAWYENWIPIDPAPALTAREVALIWARLRA